MPQRCAPATPRSSGGSREGGVCSICGVSCRPTTARLWRPFSRAGDCDCGPRRSRQVDTGPGPDRNGAGSLGGGTPPRDDHRSRLRVDHAADWRGDRFCRRPGSRAIHHKCWPVSGRCLLCCSSSPPTRGGPPQTDEHVRALDTLGVRHGLVAVTRSDLADPLPRWRRRASASPPPRWPVSRGQRVRRDGRGDGSAPEALGVLARSLPPADPDARVRLWVDRSFTVRGSGTVVTGTLVAGTVRRGDTLALGGSSSPCAACSGSGNRLMLSSRRLGWR